MSEHTTISLARNDHVQQQHARAQAALAEFFSDKPAGPLPRSVWMGDGYIEARVFNNRLHLSAVFVMPDKRESGLGSAYLRALLAMADKHQAEVECSVDPFGNTLPRLGVTDLMRWYKKHGFAAVKGRQRFLVRPACQELSV